MTWEGVDTAETASTNKRKRGANDLEEEDEETELAETDESNLSPVEKIPLKKKKVRRLHDSCDRGVDTKRRAEVVKGETYTICSSQETPLFNRCPHRAFLPCLMAWN